jgi:hypothetical protein
MALSAQQSFLVPGFTMRCGNLIHGTLLSTDGAASWSLSDLKRTLRMLTDQHAPAHTCCGQPHLHSGMDKPMNARTKADN